MGEPCRKHLGRRRRSSRDLRLPYCHHRGRSPGDLEGRSREPVAYLLHRVYGNLHIVHKPGFSNLSGQVALGQLPALAANTILGALTATTPSALAMPPCSSAGQALNWTSGSGFGCITAGGGSSGITGLTTGYIPLAGSATTLTGNSHFDDGITTASVITSSEQVTATQLHDQWDDTGQRLSLVSGRWLNPHPHGQLCGLCGSSECWHTVPLQTPGNDHSGPPARGHSGHCGRGERVCPDLLAGRHCGLPRATESTPVFVHLSSRRQHLVLRWHRERNQRGHYLSFGRWTDHRQRNYYLLHLRHLPLLLLRVAQSHDRRRLSGITNEHHRNWSRHRALGVNTGTAGAFGVLIASGTSALGTSSIASGACATVVTTTATGAASTDAISWNPNGSIKAVTGYVPSTSGGLTIAGYPTTNAVNWDVCNWSSGSITPGAVTLNWRIIR